MNWKQEYQEKLRTAEEAVRTVRSGDRVYGGTASSIAYRLLDALWDRREELEDVVLCGAMTSRLLPFFRPEAGGHFTTTTYFAGAGERLGIRNGQTTYTSFHLSQIETWCRETARPDVAFLEVSPPDENGFMSYGAFRDGADEAGGGHQPAQDHGRPGPGADPPGPPGFPGRAGRRRPADGPAGLKGSGQTVPKGDTG